MKVAIANDHAGTWLKHALMEHFSDQVDFTNYGTNEEDSVDYPDYVHPLAKSIESGENELGILICGSGNGVCMTANKYQGVRAALCWTNEISALARQHNNANVCCIPARFLDQQEATEIVNTFLTTVFEGGRHQRRVDKIPC
ncbi:MAG: ribose 5-phosphate isomerase B [Flavobacteriales bacterium]|nr:ribose 5-phosphate isomerase B [Bacteroidota bacterium]MCB9241715.1 ribose 5-phosphate isomerase B [Flavobacteriales bacterium]